MKTFICDVCKKDEKAPHNLAQPVGWGSVTVSGYAATPKYIRKSVQFDLCEKCFGKLPTTPNSATTIEDALHDFVVEAVGDARSNDNR